uniref:Uncharacterized protein n=1 Tax=Rhizophora mucronata TaxID=61149 RepID=A0A2P2NK18_RHIMU
MLTGLRGKVLVMGRPATISICRGGNKMEYGSVVLS